MASGLDLLGPGTPQREGRPRRMRGVALAQRHRRHHRYGVVGDVWASFRRRRAIRSI